MKTVKSDLTSSRTSFPQSDNRHVGKRYGHGHALSYAVAALITGLACVSPAVTAPAAAQRDAVLKSSRGGSETRLRDLAERPEKWMGRRITVEGLVNQVYGTQMFTIHGVGDPASASIPVIGADPITIQVERAGSPALRVNDRVRVTGNVLYFTREAVQDVADVRLPAEVYRRFSDRPMIVTDEVQTDVTVNGAAPRFHARGGVADVTYLITRPRLSDMIGQWARLSNVKVLNLVSDRGFWVGEGDNRRMFAVLAPALDRGDMDRLVRVKPGQTVSLIGVIERMPSREEAMRRWTTIDNHEADALVKEPTYLLVRSISIQNP